MDDLRDVAVHVTYRLGVGEQRLAAAVGMVPPHLAVDSRIPILGSEQGAPSRAIQLVFTGVEPDGLGARQANDRVGLGAEDVHGRLVALEHAAARIGHDDTACDPREDRLRLLLLGDGPLVLAGNLEGEAGLARDGLHEDVLFAALARLLEKENADHAAPGPDERHGEAAEQRVPHGVAAIGALAHGGGHALVGTAFVRWPPGRAREPWLHAFPEADPEARAPGRIASWMAWAVADAICPVSSSCRRRWLTFDRRRCSCRFLRLLSRELLVKRRAKTSGFSFPRSLPRGGVVYPPTGGRRCQPVAGTRLRGRALLLLVLLLQLLLQHLAGRVARQLVDELDLARHLVARQVRLHLLLDRVLGDLARRPA